MIEGYISVAVAMSKHISALRSFTSTVTDHAGWSSTSLILSVDFNSATTLPWWALMLPFYQPTWRSQLPNSGVHTTTKPTDLVHRSTPFGTIALHHTLTNSSYRFNTTDFTFSQYHPETLRMKSYQNLLPPLYLVAMLVQSISMLCHEAGSPYNSDTFSHLHQIGHTCRGFHLEYVYASILCHIYRKRKSKKKQSRSKTKSHTHTHTHFHSHLTHSYSFERRQVKRYLTLSH